MNYYIGLSLAAGSSMDSGVAVIDENNEIILIDKLYKMNDVIFFFENFSSLKNSKICVSVPSDRTMLEGKWRILSKPYQLVATNSNIPNRDNWTQRHSTRGSEYLNELSARGIKLSLFSQTKSFLPAAPFTFKGAESETFSRAAALNVPFAYSAL